MQQASGKVPSLKSERNLRWVLLLVLMLAAMIIYYPRASHNLPVATNVDDRTSLAVLLRFHQGSANPKFFMYPTLYYYLTYALTASGTSVRSSREARAPAWLRRAAFCSVRY